MDAVKRLGGTIGQKLEDQGELVGKVDLAGRLITDDDLATLRGFTELHSLVLRQTRITDAGLAHLKTMHKLRVLDLDETSVTDVGLAHLAELNSLRGLYLAKTRVTDAGLPALGSMKKLRELGLRGTAVTDAGLASLRELADLRVLDFRDTQVTERGVASLKDLGMLKNDCLGTARAPSHDPKSFDSRCQRSGPFADLVTSVRACEHKPFCGFTIYCLISLKGPALDALDVSSDVVGNGVRLAGVVIEHDHGGNAMGGDRQLVPADDLVLHPHAAAANSGHSHSHVDRVGISDLGAIVVTHGREDRTDPLGLVKVHQSRLEEIRNPGRLGPPEIGHVVDMSERVLLAPQHGLNHDNGEAGEQLGDR